MPRNLNYRPVLIDELITNERLNSYKNVFKHSDDMELVGAYLWNIQICSALYPLLSIAEVTLRNSIDNALSKDPKLKYFWWKGTRLHYNSFSPGVVTPHVVPHAVQALKDNFSHAAAQVIRDKKNRYSSLPPIIPTHHEIIAKTEFSTWEFILDSEFMGTERIWPKYLGKVFRGPWPTTKASQFLTYTKDLVKTVREFRNRVSHHEPVWKRYGVLSETDAINHLHEKIGKIRELISIISPEKEQLILKNGLLARAERVCSINELRCCQHSVKTQNIKSISKLCRIAKLVLDENKTEYISVYSHGKKHFRIQPL